MGGGKGWNFCLVPGGSREKRALHTHPAALGALEGCLLSECVFMGRPVFLVLCWALEMNKFQSYTRPPHPTHRLLPL